jgi:hypothetical protein
MCGTEYTLYFNPVQQLPEDGLSIRVETEGLENQGIYHVSFKKVSVL